MKYYLWINEAPEGPFEDWEILKKLTVRNIALDTLAYEDGNPKSKWIKVSEIPAIRWSEAEFPTNLRQPDSLWYYLREQNQVVGPVTSNGLQALAATGEVSPETLICRENSEAWIPHSDAFRPTAIPISASTSAPIADPNVANGASTRIAIILGVGILSFLYLFGSSHTPSSTTNRYKSSTAEGEAILKDMDSYNANPLRTQAERKEIERRMREYENKVYSK